MECQVTEAGPNQGGVVRADWGLAEPTGTVGLTAAAGLLYLSRAIRPHEAPSEPSNEVVLDRMRLAADYLARVQRPSGRIDLRDCNYDSAPDAAFAVQALCPLIELGRPIRARSTAWDAVLRSVERFVRAALVGMLDGGFHTPNHRWVMAAAMTWAGRLFPDVDVQSVVRAYLAEGFDLNEDGAYTEQSAGLYDGICDRSLMLLHQYGGNSEALQAACANLTLNLHLLHPDGTIETGASRRQDRGQRPIPAALTLPYLMAYDVVQDSRFAEAADFLWARSQGDAAGLTWYLLKRGDVEVSSGHAFPFDFARMFPAAGLWRSRRGAISATAFRGQTNLFRLIYGRAELRGVRISQSYFGAGRFVGDEMLPEGSGCLLRSNGGGVVHRPGYDFPMGRPVDPSRWFEIRSEREWRPLPPCVSELSIAEADGGYDLTYRTLDGMEGVTAQLALDFAPGGVFETADTCLEAQPGQVLFLKSGYAAMRYGHDLIEVGPGAHAHRMWAMRDAETAPEHVRVLLTFETPVQHRLRIRCRRVP